MKKRILKWLAPAATTFLSLGCDSDPMNTPAQAPTRIETRPASPKPEPIKTDHASIELNQLLQKRLDLMPAVALWKWRKKKPVEDQAREQALLDHVADLAEKEGACADEARLFFLDLMEKSKRIQLDLHQKWTINSPDTNTNVTDISTIRAEIDRLTPLILKAWLTSKQSSN